MPKISWQAQYDDKEAYDERELERERILELRWLLEVDEDSYFSIEELEEMFDNRDERGHEG